MKKVLLIIRDGWGHSEKKEYNAVANAKTPNISGYLEKYPNILIEASGEGVGLPAGYMGSSEVGHLNMGAGRVVVQELKRLKDAIEDNSLFNAAPFKACIDAAVNGGALHLMGLVQDEGVHAHQDHMFAIMQYAAQKGIKKVYIHFFADGRDTPPRSAVGFAREIDEKIKEYGIGTPATIAGRYYNMDRSEEWNLTDAAYNLIVSAKGARTADSFEQAIDISYEKDKTPDGQPMVDEYIPPTVIKGYEGVKDGDAVIFFNFRQDRAIQLTKAFVDEDYPGKRDRRPSITFCGLTKYYDSFKFNALLPMSEGGDMNHLFGEVLAEKGLKQLRLAETQKFKHVTSFFNGKRIEPYNGEDRIEIKGRFDPATFAEHPEMEAYRVAEKALEVLKTKDYDFVLINFANCDMVGHTGSYEAAVKAVEVVDECCGSVTEAALAGGYTVLITSDHGNAEEMWDFKINMAKTAHTTNPVHLVYVGADYDKIKLDQSGAGVLGDIAPTILQIMGIEKPKDMKRHSLIVK